MKELILSVVTPERSIVSEVAVEAIVMPGEAGQLTILPGHTNLLTSMGHGTFGYKTGDNWNIAFLVGGFAQVYGSKVTVLAETVDMEAELDLAKAELEQSEAQNKLKAAKAGSQEYTEIAQQLSLATAKIRAAQKKLH